jgi:Carboxypeptidase regulatory-like domain/TonB dependent receptor-like, beta-barrel
MKLRTAVFLIVGLLLACPSYAQTTGRILGVVRDESKAVLPGATVTATSPVMPGRAVTATTNGQGEYQLLNLPPGVYQITVELTGFSSYKEEDLRVTAGGTVERNVGLAIGAVTESITVSGESPIVDTRRAGITQVQTVEQVEAVPLERRAQTDYASRLPGATASSYNATNGVNIMGSPNSEVAMTQDGAPYNNALTGGGYAIGDVDNVQEVSVTMLGASAEYAQAQGGVMNVITKSGTNQFRGDARYYWLNKDSSATPVFRPCINRANPGNACTDGAETAFKWYWNPDYSAHGGGPIVHDRLWWYFGGTKVGWQFRQPGTDAQPVVDVYQRYDDRLSGKVTWKINDKITLNQTGLYEWWQYLSTFPTVTTPAQALAWYPGDIRLSGTELNWILNPTTVLAAHYSYYAQPTSFIGMGPNLSKTDITTPPVQDLATGVSSGGYFPGNQSQVPSRNAAHFKLSKFISAQNMTHNVRAGVQVNRHYVTQQQVFSSGVRYQTTNGVPTQALLTNPAEYTGETKTAGLWVEDEINLFQRLTIQPGVRYDWTKSLSPDSNIIDGNSLVERGTPIVKYYVFPTTGATTPGLGTLYTWNTFSPRVGANLKLTNDGRTVLRGSIGRYYRPSFNNDFLNATPGLPTVTTVRCVVCGVAGTDPSTVAYPTVASVVNPTANVKISPDTKAPYTNSFSLGVDREVGRNMAVSVSVAYKRWRDQLGWTDIGATYGTQVITTTLGNQLTVFPRTSAAGSSIYLLNTPSTLFETYKGIITQFTKRMSNRWMVGVGYTYSKTNQVLPSLGANSATDGGNGQDPNSLINREGPPRTIDRPHVVNAQASYLIPRAEIQVASNMTFATGYPYGATQNVSLPQGSTAIFIQNPGTYRTPFQEFVMLRFSRKFKVLSHQADLMAEIRNLLNEPSDGALTSVVYGNVNFGVPNAWAYPRRLYLGVRYNFR